MHEWTASHPHIYIFCVVHEPCMSLNRRQNGGCQREQGPDDATNRLRDLRTFPVLGDRTVYLPDYMFSSPS